MSGNQVTRNPNATLSFILLLCFLRFQRGQTNCDLNIRPSTIADSWQSSSYETSICFKSTADKEVNNYKFFHTAASNARDSNGFHWFVVKLKSLTPVIYLTIKSRAKFNEKEELMRDLSSRSIGIEIWTSPSDLHFGSDHCSSREISSQFNSSSDKEWRLCGISSVNERILNGHHVRVSCKGVHQTRMLLLRKFVENETRFDRQVMSFIDMWITTIDVKIEMHPSGPLVQNSSLTVRCSVSCRTSDTKPVSLNHPNGRRLNSSETQFDRVQPSDAGNFTCQIDRQVVSSEMLRVLYPPRKLKITAPSESSCTSPANVTLKFLSSAAEPAPKHRCVASSSGDDMVNLMKLPEPESGSHGDVASHWLCVNCSSPAVIVNVSCTAEQPGLWNTTDSIFWNCKPNVSNALSIGLVTSAAIFTALMCSLCAISRLRKSRTAVPAITVDLTEETTEFGVSQQPSDLSNIAPVASMRAHEATGTMNTKADILLGTSLPQLSQSADCIYDRVEPQSHAASISNWSGSSATVFLDIVADEIGLTGVVCPME